MLHLRILQLGRPTHFLRMSLAVSSTGTSHAAAMISSTADSFPPPRPQPMVHDITVTFLGTTSGGGPSETRNCSSLVVQPLGDARLWSMCFKYEYTVHADHCYQWLTAPRAHCASFHNNHIMTQLDVSESGLSQKSSSHICMVRNLLIPMQMSYLCLCLCATPWLPLNLCCCF